MSIAFTTTTTTPAPGRASVSSRIRAWTAAALRDLAYCGAVLAWSIVAFTVLVTGVSVTASLLVFVVGVVVWIGFASAMRWTTAVDRRLAGWQRRQPVRATYRRPAAPGVMPRVRAISADPQTWRDMGWLGVTSILGFALGLVAVTAAGIVLAYVSMPAWYWAIGDPEGHHGLTHLGVLTVDTLGEALAAAGAALALAPAALLVARGCAAAHAALAARLLGS